MNKNEISSLNGSKEETPELDNHEKLQRKKEEKIKIRTKDLKRCSAKVRSIPVKQQESGTSNSNSDVKSGKEDKKVPLKYCVFISNHPFITFGK